jgi:hypothetical protein
MFEGNRRYPVAILSIANDRALADVQVETRVRLQFSEPVVWPITSYGLRSRDSAAQDFLEPGKCLLQSST